MQTIKNISGMLAALSVTAWVGSLWAIGYLAIPALFHAQPDRQLAGMLAGEMFVWSGYLGMICGFYLLAHYASQSGRAVIGQQLFWIVTLMLLITLAIQFGIQPVMSDLKTRALPLYVMHSPLAEQFKMLHGLSSALYLAESLLGALLVIRSR